MYQCWSRHFWKKVGERTWNLQRNIWKGFFWGSFSGVRFFFKCPSLHPKSPAEKPQHLKSSGEINLTHNRSLWSRCPEHPDCHSVGGTHRFLSPKFSNAHYNCFLRVGESTFSFNAVSHSTLTLTNARSSHSSKKDTLQISHNSLWHISFFKAAESKTHL